MDDRAQLAGLLVFALVSVAVLLRPTRHGASCRIGIAVQLGWIHVVRLQWKMPGHRFGAAQVTSLGSGPGVARPPFVHA